MRGDEVDLLLFLGQQIHQERSYPSALEDGRHLLVARAEPPAAAPVRERHYTDRSSGDLEIASEDRAVCGNLHLHEEKAKRGGAFHARGRL